MIFIREAFYLKMSSPTPNPRTNIGKRNCVIIKVEAQAISIEVEGDQSLNKSSSIRESAYENQQMYFIVFFSYSRLH